MYRLTTIKESSKRGVRAYGLAALALAALMLLSVAPVQAQEQESQEVVYRGSAIVGLVRGQTARVTGIAVDPTDSSVGTVIGHVKAFNSAGNLLYQTAEVEIPPDGFYSFDIKWAYLQVRGEPRTGRVQVRLEATFSGGVSVPTGQAEEPEAGGFTIELIDDLSGKTTVHHTAGALRNVAGNNTWLN